MDLTNVKVAPTAEQQAQQRAQVASMELADQVRVMAATGKPFIAESNVDGLTGAELSENALAVKAQLKRVHAPTIMEITGADECMKPSDFNSAVGNEANVCGEGTGQYSLERLSAHMLSNCISGDVIRLETAVAYSAFLEHLTELVDQIVERAGPLAVEQKRQLALNVEFNALDAIAKDQLELEAVVSPADMVVRDARVEDDHFRKEVAEFIAIKSKAAKQTTKAGGK